MQVILGVIFHFIGGFASGSFYIPYKKVKVWAWESFWITGGIFRGLLYRLLQRGLPYRALPISSGTPTVGYCLTPTFSAYCGASGA